MTVKPMRMVAISLISTEGLFTVGAIPVQFLLQPGQVTVIHLSMFSHFCAKWHTCYFDHRQSSKCHSSAWWLSNIFYNALVQHQAYFV